MNKEDVRNNIRERIIENKQITGSGALIAGINETIKKHVELTPREKDYAFRSSLENRTFYQWAALYNVSYMTIYVMSRKPSVQKLKEEIQFNIRKFTVGMQVFLLREAMTQYLKIFRVDENSDNLEAKRKAAKEVMSWFGMAGDPDNSGVKPLNVNIFNDKEPDDMRSVSDDIINLSVSSLEKDMQELRQLEDLRAKINRESNKSKSKIKEGGGFGDGNIPEITID